MNLRLFTIALLASAIPMAVSAGSSRISLEKEDFRSARRLSRNGETIVSVKLSKSGKAKIRKLNENAVGKEVHASIGEVESDFRLKVPIRGGGLEMGPYSQEEADLVVNAINRK